MICIAFLVIGSIGYWQGVKSSLRSFLVGVDVYCWRGRILLVLYCCRCFVLVALAMVVCGCVVLVVLVVFGCGYGRRIEKEGKKRNGNRNEKEEG